MIISLNNNKDKNPLIAAQVLKVITGAKEIVTVPGYVKYYGVPDDAVLWPDLVEMLYSNAIREINIHVLIYTTAANLTAEVPEGVRDRLKEDQTVKTFQEWTETLYTSVDTNTVILSGTVAGSYLTVTDIKALDNAGYKVFPYYRLEKYFRSGEFAATGMPDEEIFENIDENWLHFYDDYKQARSAIKTLVADKGGVAFLTDAEKKIAARWHAIPSADILAALTSSEFQNSITEFDNNSIESRKRRYRICKRKIRVHLSRADADVVATDFVENNFNDSYVEIGREGTQEQNPDGVSDPEGLYDYVEARENTKWDASGPTPGLAARGYTPASGATLQQVIGILMDTLKNG